MSRKVLAINERAVTSGEKLTGKSPLNYFRRFMGSSREYQFIDPGENPDLALYCDPFDGDHQCCIRCCKC